MRAFRKVIDVNASAESMRPIGDLLQEDIITFPLLDSTNSLGWMCLRPSSHQEGHSDLICR